MAGGHEARHDGRVQPGDQLGLSGGAHFRGRCDEKARGSAEERPVGRRPANPGGGSSEPLLRTLHDVRTDKRRGGATARGTSARRRPPVPRGLAVIFLGPTLLLYLVFTVYPLLRTFYNSLFVLPTVDVEQFVGLENFRLIFTSDSVIWPAVRHTLSWSVCSAFLEIPIAFLLALALYARVPGERVFRLAWFAPMLLSYVVVGPIWQWIYNYDWGPIDAALRFAGLGGVARPWLGNLSTALATLWFLATLAATLLLGLLFQRRAQPESLT